jgi:hypothetical protein
LATSITFSADHAPFERWKRMMFEDSVAPTKPCAASGSCCQRISSGISLSSPRSSVWTTARRSRSQKCRRRPYLPATTSAVSKPSLKVLGRAPLAGHERVLARLVPEVVHERLTVLLPLPPPGHREVPRVEHGEAAG